MDSKESYSRLNTKEEYVHFIQNIELRPILWDHNMPDCRKSKTEAWEELCEIHSKEDYDTLSIGKRGRLKWELQLKWKYLKTSFSRDYAKWYNKGGLLENLHKIKVPNKSGKIPKCTENMLFLIPSFETKEWGSIYQHRSSKGKNVRGNGNDNPPRTKVKSEQKNNAMVHHRMYPVVQESSANLDQEVILVEEDNPRTYQAQQQYPTPADPLALTDDTSIKETNSPRDEDEMFLASLLSYLKDVPKHKKLMAKYEIMEVLLKYSERNPEENYDYQS
ncbi:hypothetical protein GE061_012369 [Apolygus lucorum]|uniref:BESS domain-containing protein n=1 Tax=Apolygus lucorum TaxID=248454 RepID=A0A8S9XSB5_APOLU|nr:hypothetical protein GE061_012369 [Apolygus lucorum]